MGIIRYWRWVFVTDHGWWLLSPVLSIFYSCVVDLPYVPSARVVLLFCRVYSGTQFHDLSAELLCESLNTCSANLNFNAAIGASQPFPRVLVTRSRTSNRNTSNASQMLTMFLHVSRWRSHQTYRDVAWSICWWRVWTILDWGVEIRPQLHPISLVRQLRSRTHWRCSSKSWTHSSSCWPLQWDWLDQQVD